MWAHLVNGRPDGVQISFETINAPLSKWPRQIRKLRKKVFPPWFATDLLPAPFRYRGWIIVARLRSETVGFALCDSLEGASGVYLEEVAVLPRFQNEGIGTRLVFECACLARHQGFLTMWATPLSDEEHKGIWLQKLGLIPSSDATQCSLDEIISRAESLGLHPL
jgi:GNAT superfamily N-acetyltransferase